MHKIDTIQKARDLFLSGYNCAQAVAGAFADEMGMTTKQVCKLASGFGGGMGGRRETCGAITGMVIAYSALCGYDQPTATDEKKQTYDGILHLIGAFEHTHEATLCADLLLLNQNLPTTAPSYHPTRPCVRYVEQCTALLCDYLNSNT